MKKRPNLFEVFRKNVMTQMQIRGWKQSDLAKETGITQSRVSLILNGQHVFGADVIESFANAFDVSFQSLLEEPGSSDQTTLQTMLSTNRSLSETVSQLTSEVERLQAVAKSAVPKLARADQSKSKTAAPSVGELQQILIQAGVQTDAIDHVTEYLKAPIRFRALWRLLQSGDEAYLKPLQKAGIELQPVRTLIEAVQHLKKSLSR